MSEARDLFIRLTWTGDADFDLAVDEPLGATATYLTPRTVFGGSIVKNGYGRHPEEVYVCPRGFDGDYTIKVETIYNNPDKAGDPGDARGHHPRGDTAGVEADPHDLARRQDPRADRGDAEGRSTQGRPAASGPFRRPPAPSPAPAAASTGRALRLGKSQPTATRPDTLSGHGTPRQVLVIIQAGSVAARASHLSRRRASAWPG